MLVDGGYLEELREDRHPSHPVRVTSVWSKEIQGKAHGGGGGGEARRCWKICSDRSLIYRLYVQQNTAHDTFPCKDQNLSIWT